MHFFSSLLFRTAACPCSVIVFISTVAPAGSPQPRPWPHLCFPFSLVQPAKSLALLPPGPPSADTWRRVHVPIVIVPVSSRLEACQQVFYALDGQRGTVRGLPPAWWVAADNSDHRDASWGEGR